jgi:hypothetical protein
METESALIGRKATGIRFLFTLLFYLIAQVVEAVLLAVILFELLYTLVTESPPPDRVREFANRAVAYFYRIGRYLTYNDAEPPFPFDEFPPELEPSPNLSEEQTEFEPA